MTAVYQKILSTVVLKKGKLSKENVRLDLTTPLKCQARNLSSKTRISQYLYPLNYFKTKLFTRLYISDYRQIAKS